MSRLWDKGDPLDRGVLRFTAGEDHVMAGGGGGLLRIAPQGPQQQGRGLMAQGHRLLQERGRVPGVAVADQNAGDLGARCREPKRHHALPTGDHSHRLLDGLVPSRPSCDHVLARGKSGIT